MYVAAKRKKHAHITRWTLDICPFLFVVAYLLYIQVCIKTFSFYKIMFLIFIDFKPTNPRLS